jgi:hypothetical protein
MSLYQILALLLIVTMEENNSSDLILQLFVRNLCLVYNIFSPVGTSDDEGVRVLAEH